MVWIAQILQVHNATTAYSHAGVRSLVLIGRPHAYATKQHCTFCSHSAEPSNAAVFAWCLHYSALGTSMALHFWWSSKSVLDLSVSYRVPKQSLGMLMLVAYRLMASPLLLPPALVCL